MNIRYLTSHQFIIDEKEVFDLPNFLYELDGRYEKALFSPEIINENVGCGIYTNKEYFTLLGIRKYITDDHPYKELFERVLDNAKTNRKTLRFN